MNGGFSAVRIADLLGLPQPTDEQVEVIEAPLAPAVVVAGAGSGKTETMSARVVWLVANGYVQPNEVLGLTFTRKAAAELGVRIRRRLVQWRRALEINEPGEVERIALLAAAEPTVLTYAAYAGRLVGEQAMRLGAEPNPRLLSEATRWQLADSVVRRYPGNLPEEIGALSTLPRYVLQLSDQLSDHLLEAADVEVFGAALLAEWDALPPGGRGTEHPAETAKLIVSTRHRLALMALVGDFAAAKRGAVDFGDQMALAARLAALPDVVAVERGRYRAVLLDEYQDTGHSQVQMLAGLFGAGHGVTAVGDPFQSIYGWRGASAGNMDRFPVMFAKPDGSPADRFGLAVSFRNDATILDAANAVAAPLAAVHPGTTALRARPAAPAGQVEVARLLTQADEADWIAARLRHAWDAMPVGARTAAVLVRRRAQMPALAEALERAGLPVEVVGLGGLLTTPEIVDIVSTLRVLADSRPATSLVRLLTGARWRVGVRDLAALNRRARTLMLAGGPATDDAKITDDYPVNLVEALEDLGRPDDYSSAGYARFSALAAELRMLRRRLSAPLVELVADVERTIGVDVEVGSRPQAAATGRVHLDRFLDEAARFAAESDEATLTSFLAFLKAAEDEENGLESGDVVVETERVQLLTVHGAKGLEWDIVAVPGLVDSVFPSEPRSENWTRAKARIPDPLRGDHADLPRFTITGAVDRVAVGRSMETLKQELAERHDREERRLAYVAFTRARHLLCASGYLWDTTKKPRDPSPYLLELHAVAGSAAEWEPDPPDGEPNPVTATARTALWPVDPLGARRADVEAGAALVRAALAAEGSPAPAGRRPTASAPAVLGGLADPDTDRAADWARDVETLLAERGRLATSGEIEVALPTRLSVSELVALKRDPDALARRLRRPLPSRPAPLARRGTAFHAWLEQRWSAQPLLDVDDLPGAADEAADDRDFAELVAAFERSDWASRTPAEVEVGFDMDIGATVVRGRMDAVFGDAESGWTVLDWKTGARPGGADAEAAAVQLAAYRLAWARIIGIPDSRIGEIDAAFHYVRTNETVRPVGILDADQLRSLIVAD